MDSAVRAAFCGILTALAVVFMLLVPILPVMLYCAPVLSGLCVALAAEEFGARMAFGVYAASSILSFMLVADKEAVLVFILLAGVFPVLKFALESSRFCVTKKRAVQFIIKLLYVNAACIAYFFAATRLVGIPEDSFGTPIVRIAFLIFGNLIMLAYDRATDNVIKIYKARFRNKLKFL